MTLVINLAALDHATNEVTYGRDAGSGSSLPNSRQSNLKYRF